MHDTFWIKPVVSARYKGDRLGQANRERNGAETRGAMILCSAVAHTRSEEGAM